MSHFPSGSGDVKDNLYHSTLKMLLDPAHPASKDVAAVDGVCWKMARDRVGDELDRHLVVTEGVKEFVGLGYGNSLIQCV